MDYEELITQQSLIFIDIQHLLGEPSSIWNQD